MRYSSKTNSNISAVFDQFELRGDSHLLVISDSESVLVIEASMDGVVT